MPTISRVEAREITFTDFLTHQQTNVYITVDINLLMDLPYPKPYPKNSTVTVIGRWSLG